MQRLWERPMPVVRFVREGREVLCPPGTNLRELALQEGVELYGLKGRLGNCGGWANASPALLKWWLSAKRVR